MAQLFKGHVVDDGQYPLPPDHHLTEASRGHGQPPVLHAHEIQRAAGDLERLVQLVAALAPNVEGMADAVRTNSHERGYSEGLAQAQAEVQSHLMQAIAALTDAQQQRHAIAEQNEAALADLALRIARKVIGAHLQADPKLISEIVRATIAELEPTTSLAVHVNPDDKQSVDADRDAIQRLVGGTGKVEIVADHTVDRGGCMLVSPAGEVDARVETKLEVLETAFKAQRREVSEGA